MKNKKYYLKNDSHYFFQIQGQMHITNIKKCYFLLYTNQWKFFEIIDYNKTFWEIKMEQQLILYVILFYYDL